MNSPGLYRPEYEHDNCGVGFVANIDGRRDHAIIEHGLSVLENLIHRGAVGGDGKTGDGAGMLVQLPDAFFRRVLALDRVRLPPQGEYGAGMLFVERTGDAASLGHKALALAAEELGLPWIGLRTVPTDPDCLGELALAGMPHILQFFVGLPSGVRPGDDFERDLYLMRRTAEKKMAAAGFGRNAWYVCSLSSRTIVYKGLFVGAQIRQFYPDLSAPDFASCLALVHQRYSTNTFPTWSLAQPFRFVAHNGEINTLRGNINKMRARENTMSSPLFGEDIERIRPVIDPDGSDSAVFDNVYELLTRSGRSIEHAMMMMIPEAFGVKYHISQDKRAFYEYHANFMEPWDGPAAMVFTDGIRIGATLDRNGLRPCRYTLTSDGFMVLASECGVLEIEPSRIIKKGRLMPGKMFVIDT
ncbi:MAG TPA: glutamate synthase subunit alpha, partial [Spirochaetota bacterium]|nr:glutamate synthase subunit alpha [Spirochaetota bacterium]